MLRISSPSSTVLANVYLEINHGQRLRFSPWYVYPLPSLHSILIDCSQVFFIETLHSFGIAIFVFHILPKLDAARSLLIMNAVCLVPAFLKLFLTKSNCSIVRRSLLFLMDFFAFAMQCSCVGIALASKFLKTEGTMSVQTTLSALFLPTTTNPISLLNRHRRQDDFLPGGAGGGMDMFGSELGGNNENIVFTTPASNMSSIDQNLETILAGFHIEWELPVALILVSLTW